MSTVKCRKRLTLKTLRWIERVVQGVMTKTLGLDGFGDGVTSGQTNIEAKIMPFGLLRAKRLCLV